MPKLIDSIKSFFANKEALSQGFYAFQSKQEDETPYRLHLRIEPTGEGILIVNASTVLHLNQTAVEYAYALVQGLSDKDAIKYVAKRYDISKDHIEKDFILFRKKIMTLITTPDLDPVTYLDMQRQAPYSGELSAPYRLDCALTYQVSESSDKKAAPQERVDRELTTEEWLTIIKKAFDAGIPHLLFTGGEPTTREDLPELLEYAETLGLVTGLLSDGLKLAKKSYRSLLINKGLDHLMMIMDVNNEKSWKTLQAILDEDLFTTAHLTMEAKQDLKPFIDRLAKMKVNAISLSASDPSLADTLQTLRDYVALQQIELVWDMPVPYSRWNPVSLELADVEVPQGAGSAWLYVEPDGDILPAQGVNHVLGNLLKDPWENIWNNRPSR